MPYDEPIPEPLLEPGRKVGYNNNGLVQEDIVSRVHFAHHHGKPKWEYYRSRSEKPLDLPPEIESAWPEIGAKLEFMKGDEIEVIPQYGKRFLATVMSQTSLDIRAEVYLTNQNRSKLYIITKRALREMQRKNLSPAGSPVKMIKQTA